MKNLEQNKDGTIFALPYYDSGNFKIRVFENEATRSIIDDLDVNEVLELDQFTIANALIPDPLITCCFLSDNLIFVNLFYNFTYESTSKHKDMKELVHH